MGGLNLQITTLQRLERKPQQLQLVFVWVLYPDRIGIKKCWFFMTRREKNQSTRKKPLKQDESQQQTHPHMNGTWATLVGGEHSAPSQPRRPSSVQHTEMTIGTDQLTYTLWLVKRKPWLHSIVQQLPSACCHCPFLWPLSQALSGLYSKI